MKTGTPGTRLCQQQGLCWQQHHPDETAAPTVQLNLLTALPPDTDCAESNLWGFLPLMSTFRNSHFLPWFLSSCFRQLLPLDAFYAVCSGHDWAWEPTALSWPEP